jgi:hypothetical protein
MWQGGRTVIFHFSASSVERGMMPKVSEVAMRVDTPSNWVVIVAWNLWVSPTRHYPEIKDYRTVFNEAFTKATLEKIGCTREEERKPDKDIPENPH